MPPIRLFWLECGESDLPGDESWLSEPEIASIGRRWIQKRKRDWLLGRWAAKCALAAHLGFAADAETFRAMSILPSEAGVPVASMYGKPMQASLSISHRDRRAVAAVSSQPFCLGCDLEKAESRSRAFMDCFFTPIEIEQVENSILFDRMTLTTLIWSAKESALKVLGVGLRVDTRCISVCIDTTPDFESGWHRFSASVVDGRHFAGWWHQHSMWIKTVAAAVDSLPPLQLSLSPTGAALHD